ncbi:universal stress protein [Yeosuana sp.]|uniref:universal stress protein n=1 Tax=Yeosuana sp. TaxID=2529388 RepID=UPI004054FF92
MKKILLPTDFSDNSWNAIEYALRLFKEDICTFFLLNTYTPIIYQMQYVLINPVEYDFYDVIRDASLKGLKDIHDKIQKEFNNPNHSFELISKFNSLIPEINEQINDNAIDLIIMGTKGATGATEVLFGTNMVHVLKHAECPVLAVPSAFIYETPKEVLFPTDYELNFEPSVLNILKEIVIKQKSRINVMHVSSGYDLTERQENNKSGLETYFKNATYLFHDVRNMDITEAIDEFQLKTKVNLLVMVNNKHSFFENLFFKSTINQIGFHLVIPFLVIPTNR